MLGIDGVSSQFFDDIGAVSGETTVFSSSATLKKNKVHFDQRQKPIVGKKEVRKVDGNWPRRGHTQSW